MSNNPEHVDAPPSYAMATGSSTTSSNRPNTLEVPNARNGIPTGSRRSMEDENRPLPDGWVRQFDAKEQHQFFVDTRANPPRSIWHHPYDDDDFLRTLSSEERERIQEAERDRKEKWGSSSENLSSPTSPSKSNPPAPHGVSIPSAPSAPSAPSRPSVSGSTGGRKAGFGERLKNKVTGSTHEERVEERRQREEEERQYYEAHMRFRQAMQRAQVTGQPQFFAKDKDGKDIYVEPPNTGYGAYGGYPTGAYGYNPWSSGVYQNPNARFIRPAAPYGRPYGSRGGYGLPIAGGLLGGMMLGGLLF